MISLYYFGFIILLLFFTLASKKSLEESSNVAYSWNLNQKEREFVSADHKLSKQRNLVVLDELDITATADTNADGKKHVTGEALT